MKTASKALILVLCIITVITSLVSCSVPVTINRSDDTTEKAEIADANEPAETTPEPEFKPEPKPAYKWVLEPMPIEGDIQPVCENMPMFLYPTDFSFLKSNGVQSIIGYDGIIKCKLPVYEYCDYTYCSLCQCITNHMYRVSEPDYTVTEIGGGHGGSGRSPYIYDRDTEGLISPGVDLAPATNINRAIVEISEKYELSESEKGGWYDTDYAYKNVGGYAIWINGEIVQQGFDEYMPYSCGIVALRSTNGKWGYYDAEGNEILPCEYDASEHSTDANPKRYPYPASEGILTLNKNGKWAYADSKGNMLTDFEFDEARPVYQGKAWVKTAEGWGVIELDYDYREDSALTTADLSALCGYVV